MATLRLIARLGGGHDLWLEHNMRLYEHIKDCCFKVLHGRMRCSPASSSSDYTLGTNRTLSLSVVTADPADVLPLHAIFNDTKGSSRRLQEKSTLISLLLHDTNSEYSPT